MTLFVSQTCNNRERKLTREVNFVTRLNTKKEYDAADANSGSVCE